MNFTLLLFFPVRSLWLQEMLLTVKPVDSDVCDIFMPAFVALLDYVEGAQLHR